MTFISSLISNYGSNAIKKMQATRLLICKSNVSDVYAFITEQHFDIIAVKELNLNLMLLIIGILNSK